MSKLKYKHNGEWNEIRVNGATLATKDHSGTIRALSDDEDQYFNGKGEWSDPADQTVIDESFDEFIKPKLDNMPEIEPIDTTKFVQKNENNIVNENIVINSSMVNGKGDDNNFTGSFAAGSIKVGDKIDINTDGEGGNISLYSPAGTMYQQDAYNGTFRLFSKSDSTTKTIITANASTGQITLPSAPLPVASGGTGATTAANARTNLAAIGADKGGTSYYSFVLPGNDTSSYIRTTTSGFIPPTSDSTNGSSTVGTQGWPFKTMYAKTFYGALSGNASTASSAAKLTTARKLKVALGSTTDVTFDGSADKTNIPISGTLPLANGGTGGTTTSAAQTNLGLVGANVTGLFNGIAWTNYPYIQWSCNSSAPYQTYQLIFTNKGPYLRAKKSSDADYTNIWQNSLYPVGSVYISYSSTSPASLFGGTWTQITNRVLRAAAGNGTGGSDTAVQSHNHTEIPGVSGNGTDKEVNMLAGWAYTSSTAPTWYSFRLNSDSSGTYYLSAPVYRSDITTHHVTGKAASNCDGWNVQTVKYGSASGNLPAYQNLYVWRRTA